MTDDLNQFAEWHRVRVQRRTGRPPAPTTTRNKVSKLRTCVRLAGCADLASLSTLIQDREQVERLLDALALRMSNSSVRQAVVVLLDLAEYAKAHGVITYAALSTRDMPGHNPPKAVVVYTDAEIDLMLSAARGKGLRWWAFLCTAGRHRPACG